MQQIDHRLIKLLIGVIALALAFFVKYVASVDLGSISYAYHTNARDWFVGLLFAVAALFISFKGEPGKGEPGKGKLGVERWLTILASLCAALVALAPCDCKKPYTLVGIVHWLAAGGLFAIMGYFCWRFRRTAKGKVPKYPQANRRVLLYTGCLLCMIVCVFMLGAYLFKKTAIDHEWPQYIFWVETLFLVAFGVSWLTASRALPVITNPMEKFHILTGQADEDIAGETDNDRLQASQLPTAQA